MISLLTELAVLLLLRTHRSALRSAPGRVLIGSTIAVVVLAVLVPYLGRASALFGFVPLTAVEVGAALAVVAGYVVATELAKLRFSRRESSPR